MKNKFVYPDKVYKTKYGYVKYNIVGSGEPLVLVHGTPWSSYNWRKIIPALSEWYTVYYYDLLGYGASEKDVENVSLEIQNEILFKLIEHWQLEQPKIIGHDFGGATTLRTHLLNNQKFEKMMLIDPVAVSPWGSPFYKHVEKYEEAFIGLPKEIHESILNSYIGGAIYSRLDEEALSAIKKPWLSEQGKKAFYQQIVQSNQKYTDEIECKYSEIEIPTYILWGEKDEWIPIEQGTKLNDLIPNSKLIPISEAGHLVQEEQSPLLISYILKYMN